MCRRMADAPTASDAEIVGAGNRMNTLRVVSWRCVATCATINLLVRQVTECDTISTAAVPKPRLELMPIDDDSRTDATTAFLDGRWTAADIYGHNFCSV